MDWNKVIFYLLVSVDILSGLATAGLPNVGLLIQLLNFGVCLMGVYSFRFYELCWKIFYFKMLRY